MSMVRYGALCIFWTSKMNRIILTSLWLKLKNVEMADGTGDFWLKSLTNIRPVIPGVFAVQEMKPSD